MARARAQQRSVRVGAHLVLYDGVCGLCSRLLQFLFRYDQTSASRVFNRSDAALFIAGALGWPWKAARLMRFMPQPIRDAVYEVVAANRYRLFGRNDRCLVPDPAFRDRFVA